MFGLIFLQSFFDPVWKCIALLEHARAGKYTPEGNGGKMDEYQYIDNCFDGGVDSWHKVKLCKHLHLYLIITHIAYLLNQQSDILFIKLLFYHFLNIFDEGISYITAQLEILVQGFYCSGQKCFYWCYDWRMQTFQITYYHFWPELV